MNYIKLLDYIKEFEEIYNEIEGTEEKDRVLIKEQLFDKTLNLEKDLLNEMFDSNSDVEMLCVNFIEQINSLKCLYSNSYRAALALFNTYEVFINTIFLLYKEERYQEAHDLICRKPVCPNYFNGDNYPDVREYSQLFCFEVLGNFVTTLGTGISSHCLNDVINFMKSRQDKGLIGYNNFLFTDMLLANILPLNDSYYRFNLRFENNNLERIALIEKINKKLDEGKLSKLFGFNYTDIKSRIKNTGHDLINFNISFF